MSNDVHGNVSDQTNDGLLVDAWQHVVEMVMTANQGDADAFLAACRRTSQEAGLQQQRAVSLYVGYLLRAAALLFVGHRPSHEELRVLAVSCHPRVAVILHIDREAVLRTLETAHDLAPSDEEVRAGDLVVFGTAVLGASLRDPDAELAILKRSLSNWCLKNNVHIRQLIDSG